MAKTETPINNFKINYGTYQKIQENLSQIGENELIITSDKNIPIPTANDAGKVPTVDNSGEFTLSTPLSVLANQQLPSGAVELTSLTINGVTYKVASSNDFYQTVSTTQYGTPVNP